MASALITGAAKRIGRALALGLAEKGYDLALHCRGSRDKAEQLAAEVKALGRKAQVYVCDLENSDQIEPLIKQVVSDFPELSLLINNASVFQRASLKETDEAIYDRHFAVHAKAPFFLIQQFSRHCIHAQNIINFLDRRVITHEQNYAAYGLSKKVLMELTALAALELAPKIRVNAICPGFILPPEEKSADIAKLLERIPLQRQGSIQDIVKAVFCLLDQEYLTGQLIFVDGGEHLV